MDAPLEPDVAVSVWQVASQLWKTETMNSIMGFHIEHEPCAQMICYPTLDSAEKWSKKKFEPSIIATPVLRRLVNLGSRHAGNTILSKQYPGGHLTAVGANSPSGLRQQSARVVYGDEIDAMDESAGEEGDPIELLFRRAETFPDSIKILASTPTIKGRSRIESWFLKSDQRRWHARCPICDTRQTLKWSNVVWPEGKPEEARYKCDGAHPNGTPCGILWNDLQRILAIEAGEWIATAPFQGIRGYHMSGIYSLLPASRGYQSKLHQMAAEFLRAKAGGRMKLRVWKNTFLAETDEEQEGDSLPGHEIYARREHYDDIPNAALVLTAGVDVQINRLEAEVTAWGPGEESWGVDRIIVPGHPRSPTTWKNLDVALSRAFRRQDGTMLTIACVGVDSGKWPQWVYPFVRARQGRRFYAFKGASDPAAPLVGIAKKSSVERVRLFMIGTNAAKASIYARLAQGLTGDGVCHFPMGPGGEDVRGYDETYFEQLTVERMGVKFVRGQPITVFWKMDHERNEPLDLRVYAYGALTILRPNWAALAARHPVRETPPPDTAAKPAEAPPAPSQRRRGGFVNAWR